MDRYLVQRLGFALLVVVALIVVLPILLVVGTIIVRGAGTVNWEFLSAMPRDGMKAGGIFPAIVGTLLLTLGTALAAIPVGVGGAIYLSEYARDTWVTRAIRLAIINLAGIPSVVYGLFGLGLFVLFLQFGTSILAGSLTLAIMTLPIIISAAEEALRAVPTEFRTGTAGHHHRRHPGAAAGSRRDGAHPLYRGRLLPATSAPVALRPDDGPALSPLRHQHAGAQHAAGDPVRHSIGAAGAGSLAQRRRNADPPLLPAAKAMVIW
jgi:hypothetical protein